MLTIKECRKLLGTENQKYTDQELKSMLEFQMELARIVVNQLREIQDEKESSINVSRIKR
jgi:predicted ATP-dependent Lon-type protease